MGTVFKTLYPKVAENEIEKVRKKDTFVAIRCIVYVCPSLCECVCVREEYQQRARPDTGT